MTVQCPLPIEHGVLLYTTEHGYEHYSVITRRLTGVAAVPPSRVATTAVQAMECINSPPPKKATKTCARQVVRTALNQVKVKPTANVETSSESSEILSNASTPPPPHKYLGREKIDALHFVCRECGAITFHDENGRCCCFGANVLPGNLLPEIPFAFAALLDAVPGFATKARSLNNQCSFVTIGTKSALQDRYPSIQTSWVRPQGIPTMYALKGRTFHYVPDTENRKNRFYMHMSSSTDELYSKLSDQSVKRHFDAITLYLRRHAFASAYRRVHDIAPFFCCFFPKKKYFFPWFPGVL